MNSTYRTDDQRLIDPRLIFFSCKESKEAPKSASKAESAEGVMDVDEVVAAPNRRSSTTRRQSAAAEVAQEVESSEGAEDENEFVAAPNRRSSTTRRQSAVAAEVAQEVESSEVVASPNRRSSTTRRQSAVAAEVAQEVESSEGAMDVEEVVASPHRRSSTSRRQSAAAEVGYLSGCNFTDDLVWFVDEAGRSRECAYLTLPEQTPFLCAVAGST